MTDSTDIAVFPLNTPLLPGCRMPLQIFEKRYLDMVSHCMRTDSPFCVVLLQPGSERHEVNTPEQASTANGVPFYRTGTSARIVDFSQRENGLLGLTILGGERMLLDNARQEESGLWMATATQRPEQVDEASGDTSRWKELLQQMIGLGGLQNLGVTPDALTEAEVMNYLIMLLPLPIPTKQDLLETDSHAQRWQKLGDVVALLTAPKQTV